MQEIFKAIPELNGKYECSNLGRVRRINKDIRCEKYKYLKMQTNKYGYTYVHATRTYRKLVHRIVAQLFIPNSNNYPFVNHRDLDKSNNNVNNLEWVTSSMNTIHANENGKIGNSRYIVLDLETGIYYFSLKELGKAIGKSGKNLSKINNKGNLSKRYIVVEKAYQTNYEGSH
jgi:hypothetical protein